MSFELPGLLPNYSPAEADWGIEESFQHRRRFDSVSTSDFSQPSKVRNYPTRSPTLYCRSGSFGMGSHTYSPGMTHSDDYSKLHYPHHAPEHGFQNNHTFEEARYPIILPPSTENFHKYIAKYLSLQQLRSLMMEKFKYNLVLSNLLDDSLVLSKNEQFLNHLTQTRNSEAHHLPIYLRRKFNHDGIQLKVASKKYSLLLPAPILDPVLLINTIGLIIFLLKQKHNPRTRMKQSSQTKLFRILLAVSTRILKSKRAQVTIEASRSLRSLDDFMISNCNINKVIIAHMISLKEFDLFMFLNKNSAHASTEGSHTYSKTLKKHLDMLLTCLILNMKHSIRELLPFSNGELLEKYCQINNVRVSTIHESPEPESDEPLTLETLTTKVTLFNNHRRFFVCQLLTIHDHHVHNFFVLALCDLFHIDLSSCPTFILSSYKASMLHLLFQAHTATLEQLFTLNDKFKSLYNSSLSTDHANDDILAAQKFDNSDKSSDHIFAVDPDSDLNNLSDRLLGIVASLKYFKKYSHSIANLDNADEHEERLAIFALLQKEIRSCLELFAAHMNEYKADFQAKFHPTTTSTSPRSDSQRNSQSSDSSFSLKTFHTLSARTKKKNAALSPHDPHLPLDKVDMTARSDKTSKRISAGLPLGLLMVLEDPRQGTYDQMHDGDYETNHDHYNPAALEALTKKMSNSNPPNRFFMASVNSNISGYSDLMSSTQITTDEDDAEASILAASGTRGMSKAELRNTLETSFTRIYDLETEGLELTSEASTETARDVSDADVNGNEAGPLLSASKDPQFLRSLEETLNADARGGAT